MKKRIGFVILGLGLLGAVLFGLRDVSPAKNLTPNSVTPFVPTPTPPLVLPTIPPAALIPNDYQVFQTFNNCGPASLSMALSFYGIRKSQEEIGFALRPYQNPQGDNDDKSVTLEELGREAEKFGLLSYVRPNGSIQLLKSFIAQGFPVVVETTLEIGDDIGHYRVIKGYDEAGQYIIQDDSYQGHSVRYSYQDIEQMWKPYDYGYLVMVPKDRQNIAEMILEEDLDEKIAWQKTANRHEQALTTTPDDIVSRFNLSIAYYHLGRYQDAVNAFEQVEGKLSFRTLWYQIEPIEAYYHLGNYQKVFALTDQILDNGNRAFSELYLLRGKIYQQQGNNEAAKAEFQKAVLYNQHLEEASQALGAMTQ